MRMSVLSIVRELFQRTEPGYRLILRLKYGARKPKERPHAPWANTVLKHKTEVRACLDQIHRLGLPPVADIAKNWDSLVALDLILSETDRNARIFDAGG